MTISRDVAALSPAVRPTGRFVFGLWGSEANPRFTSKIVPEMTRGLTLARRLDAAIYAIGDDAAAALRKARAGARVRSLPVTAEPFWLAKLRIIEHALQTERAVVWLDWDATQLRPLPADFWGRLQARAPLQTRIRQYHRRKCLWRRSHQRSLCGGAFIYCRDRRLILRTIDAMREQQLRGWDDEIAMAHTIDQLYGGWQGLEHYHAHHDPPWYTIRGEIFPAPEAVFTAR